MVAVESRKQPADGADPHLGDRSYDALLVVSFGGPEGMDDVMPFLENVTRGRNVPRERLEEVAHHYELFGGVSPINRQNRDLIAALEDELRAHGIDLPIFFGNRNWHPFLENALRELRDAGSRRALAFFTSAFSSYSGCRQYREDVFRAQAAVGPEAPEVLKLRTFFNHPGFVGANADRLRDALARIPDQRRAAAPVVFTAHSIPTVMADRCRYAEQLAETARLVADAVGVSDFSIVYQSRSGPPHVPWLEPDVCDHLRELGERGVTDVVVSPVGFVSDHLEVLYDLDVEAVELGREIGLNVVRAGTAGTHPAFVSMIRELIEERLDGSLEKRAAGRFGPSPDVCPTNCCLPGSGAPSPWDESPTA
jgi:protoporphyrin/coproporphyrin ferrochelatase